jgi:hypothetical protein
MELIDNGNGKGQPPQQETPKKSHEQYLQAFAGELNEILQKGYPMAAVLQVLDSAIFELRMGLYFSQMEQLEREKRNKIQIPKMNIPTNKGK